jgi:hypothetical protein
MGDTVVNYTNHIGLVLDASSSMRFRARTLIKVADSLIADLAELSKTLDQETRVTVYVFADDVQCIIYDKDVLRLPSIASFYNAYGNTALIDATMQAIDDMGEFPQRYGDHAFLLYVLTDGQENISRRHNPKGLSLRLNSLSKTDNWTVGVLVPDASGVFTAKSYGFPAQNVAVWSPESARGVEDAGRTIREATKTYMTNRAAGVRSSQNLFATGEDKVNAETVKASGIKPLAPSKYDLVPIIKDGPIKEIVEDLGLKFKLGKYFYQLTKTETIQPQKDVAILEVATGKIYTGREARNLLGLPDVQVRAKPDTNKKYIPFVQSTASNRKILAGTKLLILK